MMNIIVFCDHFHHGKHFMCIIITIIVIIIYILRATLLDRCSYYPYFTDKNGEEKRVKFCHRYCMAEPGLTARL